MLPLDLTYEAPAACPPVEVFAAELEARVDDAAHAAADPRRFRVRIEAAAKGFHGVLTVEDHAGTEVGRRETDAARCDAVARSLAVFVAIALDAAAAPEPAPPAQSAPPPPPLPRRAEPAPPRKAAPRPRAKPWLPTAGAHAFVSSGGFWGVYGYAELGRDPGPRKVETAFRLSLGTARRVLELDAGGRADFELVAGRAAACVRTRYGIVVPSGCAALEVGRLVGTTSGIPSPGTAASAWIAPMLLVGLRVELTRTFALEWATGPLVPLRRPLFELDEGRPVYRAPAVLWGLEAGLALTARWP